MDAIPRPDQRTTYRSVFAGGETRVLFGTVLLYGLGFQFEILGLAVLVYARTESPLLSAVAFGIGFLPQVVGGALFTALADRLPARTVIAAGLLVRAAPGLAIGLVPGMPVGVMMVLVAVAAMVSPVFTAAAAGLLPDLLDGDRYVLGRSIFHLMNAGTQIVGLGIGGVVLAVVPAPDLLLGAGGVLVLAAVASGAGLRHHTRRPVPGDNESALDHHRGVLRTTITGNGALLANREVRGLLFAQWLPAWFVAGAESLIVPYVGALGRSSSAASALLAALPVGMIVGEVVIGRYCRARMRRRLAFPLAMTLGLPLLVFGLEPSVPVAAALLVVSGFGFSYQLGIQQAFLGSLPTALRGQAFGLNATGLMGGQGLSPPVAGALVAVIGIGGAMSAAGVAAVLAALALRGTLTGSAAGDAPLEGAGRNE